MALLDARRLTVSYGGVPATDALDLSVEADTIVGLIGPNGAGKTTFIDAISGFKSVDAGNVHFRGVDVTRSSPAARARAGLARTFQSLELFEDLTVRDNVMIAADRPRWYALLADLVAPGRGDRAGADRADAALDVVGLGELAGRAPRDLSMGQRKLVGVARALASDPSLLLLDEPAAGLDSTESRELGERLRALCRDGTAILLVDHDMDLVLDVCTTVYVLDFGRIIAHGTPAQVRADPSVVEAYLTTTSRRRSRCTTPSSSASSTRRIRRASTIPTRCATCTA
jgi:branched-chain amino acid transport system ATP-binding protein